MNKTFILAFIAALFCGGSMAGTASAYPPPPKIEAGNIVSITPTLSIDIVIKSKYRRSAQVKKLYRLLGIKGSPNVIHFVDDASLASKRDNIISFKQRNYLTMLYFLRNAVEVSSDAANQGLIEQLKNPDGTPYHLTNITKKILSIHSSKKEPQCNVSVSVYYRKHWFYIADNDLQSKRTFALLQQLFNLQSGDKITQSPVLTIPVA